MNEETIGILQNMIRGTYTYFIENDIMSIQQNKEKSHQKY